jgi:glycine C-acetyltransferase
MRILIKKKTNLIYRVLMLFQMDNDTNIECSKQSNGYSKSNSMVERLQKEGDNIRSSGLWKSERVITSPQSDTISITTDPLPMINFCSNNYLGLSSHPRVIEAAKKTIDTRGFGMSSSRFICGTQDIHKELEESISRFHGTQDTLLYASCFDANTGIFEQLLSNEDAILSDSLNHASIIDGIRLCKAQRYIYNHLDMEDLERKLEKAQSHRNRLIVTDGVFSMDGDVTPLKKICDLASKYDAQVFIDECHATGFIGMTGRGTPELCGVEGRIDIINSTLGKALGGGMGGYTTGPKEIIDLLRQRSRPYLFSNTLVPSVVGGCIEVFKILNESNEQVSQLHSNVTYFRKEMINAGFKLRGSEYSPIVPIMIGDAMVATKISEKLLLMGIYVIAFSYPVVPRDEARIRCQISALHTLSQMRQCVDAFIRSGRELGIIAQI